MPRMECKKCLEDCCIALWEEQWLLRIRENFVNVPMSCVVGVKEWLLTIALLSTLTGF